MNCPKCNEKIPVFSKDKTVCKHCGSKLISKNSKTVNFVIIVIWGLIGRLVILSMFDSVIVTVIATVLIAVPILLCVRKLLVEYEFVRNE